MEHKPLVQVASVDLLHNRLEELGTVLEVLGIDLGALGTVLVGISLALVALVTVLVFAGISLALVTGTVLALVTLLVHPLLVKSGLNLEFSSQHPTD